MSVPPGGIIRAMNTPPDWAGQAACRHHEADLWWPEPQVPEADITAIRARIQSAIEICGFCPVRAKCLDHAMTAPEYYGIWGGMTENQRRGMRRAAS